MLADEREKLLQGHLSEVYTDSRLNEAYYNAINSRQGQFIQSLDFDTVQKAIKIMGK